MVGGEGGVGVEGGDGVGVAVGFVVWSAGWVGRLRLCLHSSAGEQQGEEVGSDAPRGRESRDRGNVGGAESVGVAEVAAVSGTAHACTARDEMVEDVRVFLVFGLVFFVSCGPVIVVIFRGVRHTGADNAAHLVLVNEEVDGHVAENLFEDFFSEL